MYYLFEYRLSEGKSKDTYGPYKCHSKIDPEKPYNKDLVKQLNQIGIVHKYENFEGGWKTLYMKIPHDNVMHGGSFGRIMDLFKKFERDNTIDKLLSGNI